MRDIGVDGTDRRKPRRPVTQADVPSLGNKAFLMRRRQKKWTSAVIGEEITKPCRSMNARRLPV
jgi:hypothetical protein